MDKKRLFDFKYNTAYALASRKGETPLNFRVGGELYPWLQGVLNKFVSEFPACPVCESGLRQAGDIFNLLGHLEPQGIWLGGCPFCGYVKGENARNYMDRLVGTHWRSNEEYSIQESHDFLVILSRSYNFGHLQTNFYYKGDIPEYILKYTTE